MMSKLIIANWKAHPATEEAAVQLAKESDIDGLVICPPTRFIKAVSATIKNAKLGSQNLSDEQVEYAIIGHSDRRKLGETDEMVAEKMAAAVKSGLIPILCVGETRTERDSGKTEEVVGRELRVGLSLTYNLQLTTNNLVIAYEPIWAIGTGTPDSPESMLNMVEFIKGQLVSYVKTTVSESNNRSAKILYGGSVTSQNAEEFLNKEGIDGALVGGASLNPKEIKKIVEIAKRF